LSRRNDLVLNVRPKDLLDRARGPAPGAERVRRRRRALRPVPPAWRTCRVTMSHTFFFAIVGVWIGGLAILLAVALALRWS
jgi:hypothetical protein